MLSYGRDERAYVSTGDLPRRELVWSLVEEAYERYRSDREGETSKVYPALAVVPADLFGMCIADTHGALYRVGDADHEFAIMSVSKPFVFALVCDLVGSASMRERVGVNSTGLPFNSLTAVERSHDGRTNPMVNAGAIATSSLVPGRSLDERWQSLLAGMSGFAGRALSLDQEVYASASATNARNQGIAQVLHSYGGCTASRRRPSIYTPADVRCRSRRKTWPSWVRLWPTAG